MMTDENLNLDKKNFDNLHLCQIAKFLNQFTYEICIVQNNYNFMMVKENLLKLLKELYNRDSRKKFTNT